jgi:hypothetical protein
VHTVRALLDLETEREERVEREEVGVEVGKGGKREVEVEVGRRTKSGWRLRGRRRRICRRHRIR